MNITLTRTAEILPRPGMSHSNSFVSGEDPVSLGLFKSVVAQDKHFMLLVNSKLVCEIKWDIHGFLFRREKIERHNSFLLHEMKK